MKYNIIISDEKIFASDISKIGKKEVENIFIKLENLKIYGIKIAQVKRLKNYKLANFRLRVGNYRILFDFNLENKEIIIFRVLHRSKLY